MSLVGIGSSVEEASPGRGLPPLRAWPVLPLASLALTAPVSGLRSLALNPGHRVPCETFSRYILDRDSLHSREAQGVLWWKPSFSVLSLLCF